jgi:hypothetical protein
LVSTEKKFQRGNVLFLILIAVALFAALSYAVTQSSRSGGDASKETNVVNTASLTQYPNSVRTAVLRMIIAGIDPEDLQFNHPDQFDTGVNGAFIPSRGVFYPDAGGATYQQIPENLTSGGMPIDWTFTLDYEIPILGISAPGPTGNEVIAFADGITQSVCDRVNKELHGYAGATPVRNAALSFSGNRIATTTLPGAPAGGVLAVDTPTIDWLDGKAFGCFQNGTGGNFVFYYAMAER